MNNLNQMIGSQSIKFENPPHIIMGSATVGSKEGEGPLGRYFDSVIEDPMFGQKDWDAAESKLMYLNVKNLMEKAKSEPKDFRYIFSGDLQGQLTATTFGIQDFGIPLFGLYGACSTMGEALSLAAITVAGDFADKVIASSSSHFASAEKAFRFPLEYGNQRPFSATWTVTGCGSVIVGKEGGFAKITGITTGKIVDFGVKDSANMGACMAPAAADVIYNHLKDFNSKPEDYDRIITGDLGVVGQRILIDLLNAKGINISPYHMDCGIEIFENSYQDTHSGGSGCGCSASVLCGYIFNELKIGNLKKILFIPTGALMSKVSFNEGNTVPGIAHCVMIERI